MDRGTFWLPPQASTTAAEVDALFYFIYWASAAVLLLVTVCMVYFAYKYRRRSHADRPQEVKESKMLEASWIVIPTILVLVVFFWGFRVFVSVTTPPPNPYEVRVQAAMWNWAFYYNEGIVTTNELVVPAGVPVRLLMSSVDVLHSFAVPAFRLKQDVLPNRYTTVWFEAREPGDYLILCTEFCGTGHSVMSGVVRVLPLTEFYEWIASGGGLGIEPDSNPVEIGAQLFEAKACNTCHSIDGTTRVGPSFLGTWGQQRPLTDGRTLVMDEEYVRGAILNPNAQVVQGFQPVMPSYQGQMSDEEIFAIIQFMRDINDASPAQDFREVLGDGAAPENGTDADTAAEADAN
ncbi:cytochrome c oxidase subunit II [soil metagenome]